MLLAGWIAGTVAAPWTALAAGLGAVLGHLFPVWLGFRGGKGVATGLGVILAAAWPVGLVSCAAWLAGARLARISSVGALLAFAAAPLAALALGNRPVAAFTAVVAVLVFARHASNIRRLLAGTEPRIGKKA
jgi:glycerol-3-phosphate acyltransferase PlsY